MKKLNLTEATCKALEGKFYSSTSGFKAFDDYIDSGVTPDGILTDVRDFFYALANGDERYPDYLNTPNSKDSYKEFGDRINEILRDYVTDHNAYWG